MASPSASSTRAVGGSRSSSPQPPTFSRLASPAASSPNLRDSSSLASPRNSGQSGVSVNFPSPSVSAGAARRTTGARMALRFGQSSQQNTSALGEESSRANSFQGQSNPGSHDGYTSTMLDDDHDVWAPGVPATHVYTPPGAVENLPSMSLSSPTTQARDLNPPWIEPALRAQGADYDWAAFVYAYSRGKWDPARLPQPPSQSNVFPGAESRISLRDSVGSTATARQRSCSPVRPSAAADVAESTSERRPSLDYIGAAPGAIKRLLSDPDRKTASMLLHQIKPLSAGSLLSDGRDASSARAREGSETTPMHESDHFEDRAGPESGGSAADMSPLFTNPFKQMIALSTSASMPDMHAAEATSAVVSNEGPRRPSGVRRPSGETAATSALRGAKTDSEVLTRNSDAQLPSGSTADSSRRPSNRDDIGNTSGGVLASAVSPPLDHASLASAVTAARPALAAQVSEMNRRASFVTRGNQGVKDASATSGGSTPARPHPIPVQAKDSEEDVAASQKSGESERKSGGEGSGPIEAPGAAFLTPSYKRTHSEKEPDKGVLHNSVEGGHSRRASAIIPKLPIDLAHVGHSHSSPSISTYLGIGKRIETFYKEHGYLPAIMPPNETERREALRRYGPPRVRGDANFVRLAHLVKLVFDPKIVLITLLGETTQFFQTEVGAQSMGRTSEWLQQVAAPRDCSMCTHAILQPNDEPLVVLDTHRDWRFAGNPLVRDDPKIRFYAGSPLRTPDGFNLGSLCIIDDRPWTEFTPRHRHTLREFARVVMREMELVRDTIHLRTQDRMQHSIELFTRKCIEMESEDSDEEKGHSQGLHQVYDMAAKGMCEALQAAGAIIFDLSQFEVVTSRSADVQDDGFEGRIFLPTPQHHASHDNGTEGGMSSNEATQDDSPQMQDKIALSAATKASQGDFISPMAVLGACEMQDPPPNRDQNVPASHYIKIAEFLRKHRTGFFYPFIPAPFRHLLPPGMSHVLLVPIFGLNRQPFALLCAYSRDNEMGPTLEDIKDSGLQYLRAMGTIILSAILKNDIMLADKAKSHFISNISHELRTPLHGILAAAELLAETKMNATQGSYLETVEACGKSLLELVNHVLDFTKLSGNMHSNKKAALKPTQRCDLVKLIQEVCESSWIGQMAKNLESQQYAGIGSAYAKGSEQSSSTASSVRGSDPEDDKKASGPLFGQVETVIDVSMRASGWLVKCDAGGIRRVLMNLIGNSLKFTTKGFVHVSLREVQSNDTHVLVEIGVTDTGKGISRTFLEEQLFHPFTQENHLGPGTGLGLSIVNSIVQSPAINGKIDVWSTVGQGTEIRVTCELELSDTSDAEGPIYKPVLNVEHQRSVVFMGFNDAMRGQSDLKDVLRSYYEDWWRFKYLDGTSARSVEEADIVLINDDTTLIRQILKTRTKPLPPVILLTGARGKPEVTSMCEEYEARGGVVRLLFKPAGPAKMEAVTDFCLQCFDRGQAGLPMLDTDSAHSTPLPSPTAEGSGGDYFGEGEATVSQQQPSFDVEDDAVTPRGQPGEGHGLGTLPGRAPLRPRLSNELRRNSHHISPGPPSAQDSVLLRRHSHEDRDGEQSNKTAYVGQGNVKGLLSGSSSSNNSSASGKEKRRPASNRPLMPTRSITYHEPRLGRHVLMSPLRSPHYRRGDGGNNEPMDYFGPGAAAAAASTSASKSASTTSQATLTPSSVSGFTDSSGPASPGSVISLEGGEGAVLRSAVHTAGLVRVGGANQINASSGGVKKRLQVLSVEDNAINRRVLAAFFGKMDVDLVEATNGEEGVRAFESRPPFYFDVIFMDLSMPVLDGIGAMLQIRKIEADRFRAENSSTSAWLKAVRISTQKTAATATAADTSPTSPTSSLSSASSGAAGMSTAAVSLFGTPGGSRPSAQARAKIFALTGRSSDEDKRRVFATGADGFIVKPLSYKVLSSLIHTISAYK